MSAEILELAVTLRWIAGGAGGLLVLVLGGLVTVVLRQNSQLAILTAHRESDQSQHRHMNAHLEEVARSATKAAAAAEAALHEVRALATQYRDLERRVDRVESAHHETRTS